VFLANVAYAAAGLALLVFQRRAASTATDRRRIGVLIFGTATGAAAGAAVIAGYWLNPGAGIFTTRPMTLLAPSVLTHLAASSSFSSNSARVPESGPVALPTSLTVIRVLSLPSIEQSARIRAS